MSETSAPTVTPVHARSFVERVWFAYRAGWRPASGWICVAVILVNGVVLPLARLFGCTIEPLDWRGITPFVALLIGQSAIRGVEKSIGGLE